jgi:hypothetical protein
MRLPCPLSELRRSASRVLTEHLGNPTDRGANVKRSRSVLLLTGLAAGALIGSAATADAGLPATATPVSVSSGAVHSGVDASVKQYGAIGGKIKSVATGGNISGAAVYAYSGSAVKGLDFSDASGNYQINGLAGGAYKVCVSTGSTSGGGSTTGYLSRCYKTVAWNGHSAPPSAAAAVTVTAGNKKSNINVSLPSGAAISGKVKNAGGTGLEDASVLAKNRNTGQVFFAQTNSTGAYKLTGLTAASSGYSVCFDGTAVSNSGATGYLDRCWKNVGWSGSGFPSGATKVTVALGKTHTGIGATLPRGGAISGVVKDANTGALLPYVSIAVFNSSGKILRYASTNNKGQYTAKSLPAATKDYVCAYPFSTSTATLAKSYRGRCYKNVAWSGGKLPTGPTGVKVTIGSVHKGISLSLPKTTAKLGSIAGTIKSAGTGNPVIQFGSVTAYTSGGTYVTSTSTNASGAYKLTGLKANSTGYVVCATAQYGFATTTPPTKWAPHCYQNANWDGSNKVPAAAMRVPLSAGQAKGNINITLPIGGGISGNVTVFGSANPASVQVEIYNATTHRWVTSTYTFGNPYEVDGLAGGYSYIVCFDGRYNTSGTTPYGSVPQCFNNVAWNGSA